MSTPLISIVVYEFLKLMWNTKSSKPANTTVVSAVTKIQPPTRYNTTDFEQNNIAINKTQATIVATNQMGNITPYNNPLARTGY